MSSWDAERQSKRDGELDNICREHQRLENDLASSQHDQYRALVNYIDGWEANAIKRIEKTAATAREDVEKALQEGRQDLQHILNHTVTEELRETLQEEVKLTEFNIDRWLAHLHEIRKRLENISSSVEFSREKVIRLIKVKRKFPPRTAPVQKPLLFEGIRGRPTFHNAEALINSVRPSVMLSKDAHSTGTHYFRFRIEKSNHELFFGIIDAADSSNLKQNNQPIESIYGWWNMDRRVLGGRKESSVSVLNIFNGDELILILNCDVPEIFLEYPSMNKLNSIKLPDSLRSRMWKLLIEVGKPGDCLIRTLDWGKLAHGTDRPENRLHCFCASDPILPQTRASYREPNQASPIRKKKHPS